MKTYKSIVVEKSNNTYKKKIKTQIFNELGKNEVLIKIQYSSINYKDYLVCNGKFWDCRKYPLVPGIDAAGKVIKTRSKKFKIGDTVAIIARQTGSKLPGGLSQYIKVLDKLIDKLPRNISPKVAMEFGTAGFSAMYIIHEILKNGKKLNNIAVSGSSGGVGSIAINVLSQLGYYVTAFTSSSKNKKLLKKIGAKKIKNINNENHENLALQKKEFDFVIDCVGGIFLSNILKKINLFGILFSIGFSNKNEISNVNLTPFILRSVKIFGIHIESMNNTKRDVVWKFISNYQKKYKLDRIIIKQIQFNEIINELKYFNKKNKFGRVLVKI